MSPVYAPVWGTLIQQPQETDAHGEQIIQNLDNLGLKGTSSNPAGGALALVFLICCCSLAKSYPFVTPWIAALQASLPFIIFQSLLKFMFIEWVMLSNHLILCHPLFLLPSIFPASGSIPMSWLFPSGGLRIETSASVLPIDIQGWYPLGLIGLIFLLSKGLSRVFSNTTIWKHQFFGTQPSLWSKSHICTWLLEKP